MIKSPWTLNTPPVPAGPQKSKEQRKQERKARLDAERGSGGTDPLLAGMQKPTVDDLEAVGAAKPSRAAQVCAPRQASIAFLVLTRSEPITKNLGGCWRSSAQHSCPGGVLQLVLLLSSTQHLEAIARLLGRVSPLGSALQHATRPPSDSLEAVSGRLVQCSASCSMRLGGSAQGSFLCTSAQ